MASKAYAAVVVATRTMEIQAFDLPVIGEDDGLLRVELCGVCGSDPRIYSWTDPKQFPLIMGHELVGHIEQLGSRAAARWGVQVGDRVSIGDALCVIEAMKMMNQIEAEVAGTIKSIRVQNGDPVEYGQILFVIDQRTAE